MSYNRGKKFNKNNSKIEPFIKRGFINNGKVEFNTDGLSLPQINFVNGVKNTLNKQVEVYTDTSNLFALCMYSSKNDFFGGLSELKDDITPDQAWQEALDMFESKHTPKVIPLNRISQILHNGLTAFQHSENNKYYQQVWNRLNDGGCTITDQYVLEKVESQNGFMLK